MTAFQLLQHLLKGLFIIGPSEAADLLPGHQEDVYTSVINFDIIGGNNPVDAFLRAKIDDDFDAKLIVTVRGMGYVLEAPDDGAVHSG